MSDIYLDVKKEENELIWDKICNQLKRKVIAVDFDETLTEKKPYPIQGDLRKDAKKYITKLAEKGYTLVLWSARIGDNYKIALDLCKKWNLPILEDTDEFVHGDSGKLIANFYIDDKAVLGKLRWRKVYNYIVKHI